MLWVLAGNLKENGKKRKKNAYFSVNKLIEIRECALIKMIITIIYLDLPGE